MERKKSFLKIYLSVLLLTSMMFSLTIHAQPNLENRKPSLIEVVLCKDVKDKDPQYETTLFDSFDEKIVSWIRFNYHADDSFVVTWEWVGPEEKVYHIGEIEMESGHYQNYRIWYWISVKDHLASDLTGNWLVRVSVDNTLLNETHFLLAP